MTNFTIKKLESLKGIGYSVIHSTLLPELKRLNKSEIVCLIIMNYLHDFKDQNFSYYNISIAFGIKYDTIKAGFEGLQEKNIITIEDNLVALNSKYLNEKNLVEKKIIESIMNNTKNSISDRLEGLNKKMGEALKNGDTELALKINDEILLLSKSIKKDKTSEHGSDDVSNTNLENNFNNTKTEDYVTTIRTDSNTINTTYNSIDNHIPSNAEETEEDIFGEYGEDGFGEYRDDDMQEKIENIRNAELTIDDLERAISNFNELFEYKVPVNELDVEDTPKEEVKPTQTIHKPVVEEDTSNDINKYKNLFNELNSFQIKNNDEIIETSDKKFEDDNNKKIKTDEMVTQENFKMINELASIEGKEEVAFKIKEFTLKNKFSNEFYQNEALSRFLKDELEKHTIYKEVEEMPLNTLKNDESKVIMHTKEDAIIYLVEKYGENLKVTLEKEFDEFLEFTDDIKYIFNTLNYKYGKRVA